MRKFSLLLLFVILLSGCLMRSELRKEALSIGKSKNYSPINVQKDNSKITENINNSVYKRAYFEQEANTVPRVMFLEGSENLKVFPYKNAESINKIRDTFVIIHTVVINDEREEWVLIEYTDVVNTNNYGYIKLDRLSEKSYTPLYICDKEAISEVAIGDIAEKAIVQYGDKYHIYKSELGWSYLFNKENGRIVVHIDPISNTVKGIDVSARGYKTKEGYQVGDNAMKTFDSYKSKYEMNTEQYLFNERPESIFHLGDGYVIEFDYEPKELSEDSVITQICFYNIYDGDW